MPGSIALGVLALAAPEPSTILGLIATVVVVLGAGGFVGLLTARTGDRKVRDERQATYDARQDRELERLRARNDQLELHNDLLREVATVYRLRLLDAGVPRDELAPMPDPLGPPTLEAP